jgi:hypothetical protein
MSQAFLYETYRTQLGADRTSASDAIALANTPAGANNPANNTVGIGLKTANARAVAFAISGGTPCPILEPATVASACI